MFLFPPIPISLFPATPPTVQEMCIPIENGIDCFDVIVVTQGTLYMHVHHESYAIHAGSVLIIPPNTSHYGYKICNETTFFHWLHFNTAESFNISDLPKSLGEPHVAWIDEAAENIVSFPLFQSLSNESFAKICSLLQQLESMSINRFEKSTRILKPIGSPLHQQSLLMQILQILSMFPDNTVKNNSCYMILHICRCIIPKKLNSASWLKLQTVIQPRLFEM